MISNRILDALSRYAYKWSFEPRFRLHSGQLSNEYLDCSLALSHPDVLADVGELFWRLLDGRVDAIGGLTFGADPIAIATSLAGGKDGSLRWFSVRRKIKDHRQQRRVEGDVSTGDSVLLVDDVVTSGDSILSAAEACLEAGLVVYQVLALVDRQAGGLDLVRKSLETCPSVSAVFTIDQIRTRYLESGT